MILLIDNYDSFTYNLAQMLGKEQDVCIVRNDDECLFAAAEQAAAIVISPGPGTPAETGFVKPIIQKFYQVKPILGICLGHQTIGEVFGAKVVPAERIRHGKQSEIAIREGSQLFTGIGASTSVIRYHSLVIQPASLPEEFIISATACDDQEIMAIEHQHYPLFGIQFHPESIGTAEGGKMMHNFIQRMEATTNERII